ncbi:hypothetical protein ACI2OX_17285 [Bacillus sp. N9]
MTTAALISVGGIGTATSVWASSNTPTIDEKARETLASLEYAIGNSDFIKEVEENPTAITVHEEFVEVMTGFSDFHHGEAKLIAVRPSDESKFSAEEWQEILKKIENGEIYWEEEVSD